MDEQELWPCARGAPVMGKPLRAAGTVSPHVTASFPDGGRWAAEVRRSVGQIG